MGDSDKTGFRESVLEQGPADVTNPVVAWLRFWTQGWRFHGRASRSEFWWWEMYIDPFGVVPSPRVSFHLIDRGQGAWFGWGGGERDVWPDAWDLAILVPTILTIVPRWSLLVRRLHDRDHAGLWILLLVFTGPLGAVVLGVMVARSSRPGGARFDRGLFAGGWGPEATGRHMSSSTTGVA
ncbi:hypothetical protein DEJ05_14445 [Curtobacterium sp. MCLR17_045]|uniref:DUF805 domain-containing protein n=1 Tax=Curtobacterium sp. MCLR17_045 TaxID=2175629 RepID=UPI000DA8889E|nr:DUF805 domain-containing protein [Curtobacterium sp. MCLR17_045]PZF23370.1 hypothetical protein DEJ05_14445 [Curtobacterium sp. MCLR17_045]